MKKLALSALNDLFAAINAAETLYIPADDAAGQASFTRWQAGMQLSKKLNTVRSAKDLFFPQVENLMGFRVSEKQIELIEMRDETAPFVLFGVRACDARSFEILDKVFLAEPVDTYYQARREHGLHDRQLTVETEHPQQDDTPHHQRALERKLLPLDDCR